MSMRQRAMLYLRRPDYMRDKVRELLHRHEPWISPEAVRFCAAHLTREQVGLEWGSGYSTRWYAERLGKLLSIESNPRWHTKVSGMIRHLESVECRFIPLEHPLDRPTRLNYDPLPQYVAVVTQFDDKALDFIVVDGHYRQACVKQAMVKLKEGGLLLLDDYGFLPLPEWGVPNSWPIVHKSSNSYKDTIIWRRPGTAV
jgi:hypothetical protein